MKKEKKVRAYQRRTKSGKTVTVRAHTASYEAAEKAKEAAKKKGAGDEIAERKKKNWELPMDEFLKKLKEERAQKREDDESMKVEDEKPKKKSEKTEKKTPAKKTTKNRTVGTGTNGTEPKKKTTTKKTAAKEDSSEPAFTRDEFKEWYRGTGSAADKKVAKALRKQLGRSGYRKFEDEAIDNYTSRGHLSMFKRVSGGSGVNESKKGAEISKAKKDTARGSKEKATEAKSSKAKESKSVKAPKKESLKQRDARWNRGEFTDAEKSLAITVYDLSGSKNNLHPKLSAWAKKEIKGMDDERAAKVDTKILKGLNRDVVSKLATLQGKKKLSKEDEAFIDKHVAPSGLIRGTKVSAFDAISAHRKDSKEYKGTPKASTASKSTSVAISKVSKSDRNKIISYVESATDGEYASGKYTWKDTLAALRHPSESTVRGRVERMYGVKVDGVKKRPYSYYNDGSKKRSVGTGTNGPEPKKTSKKSSATKTKKAPIAKKTEPPNMKKELSSLITGLKGSTMRTYQKPAKFTSRKDGTIETSVYGVAMAENLRKKGWKNVDKVTVVGGTKNYVSPDGKYHAMVSKNKTKIRPIKKGEKVEGHSWDSIFNV